MQKVEEVARALAVEDGYDPDEMSRRSDVDENWPMWKLFVPRARAAIEAMRVPTPGMLKAAGTVPGYDWEDWTRDPVADHTEWWNEMIDAALAENDGTPTP